MDQIFQQKLIARLGELEYLLIQAHAIIDNYQKEKALGNSGAQAGSGEVQFEAGAD